MIIMGQGLTTASTDQRAPLGTKVWRDVTHSGKKYRNCYQYVVAGEALTAGRYCEFNGDTPYEVDNDLTSTQQNICGAGMAMAAATAGQHIWVLVEGVDTINTWSAGAFQSIQANATTGALTGSAFADADRNVGFVTVDNVAILAPPAAAGFADNTT